MNQKINHLLRLIYPEHDQQALSQKIADLTKAATPKSHHSSPTSRFDQRDVMLITYADMVYSPNQTPLQALGELLHARLQDVVSAIHLLPFYPYTTDDGFSVVDYKAVNPDVGSWNDIAALRQHFRLMFDAVINHCSQQNSWFQAYLRDESPFDSYFIDVPAETDLSAVFRPRTLPLLTPFQTISGEKYVWTTFSADQVDLNFASPDLLLEILRILLIYVEHGADFIRLDAIGFMWKEIGTSCLHLPQTHALIKLMRALLNEVAPQVALITETNVPHKENISYFGNGHDEAQMVYNFSLPPLTLHAFHTGSAKRLSEWADTLNLPSDETTFFNFLASHDGIGLTPARGLIEEADITAIANRVEALGGHVSYKTNSDGSQSAYELNINYLDALGSPGENLPDELIARRFLASQSIMLALRGVPGIYFHSLFGSNGWPEGVVQTGMNRTINRQKLPLAQLNVELETGLRSLIFNGYCALLQIRRAEVAFSPHGGQKILNLHPSIMAIQRHHDGNTILCLHNVAHTEVSVGLPFTGRSLHNNHQISNEYTLAPYETLWLKQ